MNTELSVRRSDLPLPYKVEVETLYGISGYEEMIRRDTEVLESIIESLNLPPVAFERAGTVCDNSEVIGSIDSRFLEVSGGGQKAGFVARYDGAEQTAETFLKKTLRRFSSRFTIEQRNFFIRRYLKLKSFFQSIGKTNLRGSLDGRQTTGLIYSGEELNGLRVVSAPTEADALEALDRKGDDIEIYHVDDIISEVKGMAAKMLDFRFAAALVKDTGKGGKLVLVWGTNLRSLEQVAVLAQRRELDSVKSIDPGKLPRISIVTVSYNQANFIERTLESVLNQGYPNLEYIVIDGGSDDGTVEILEKYRDQIEHLVIEPDDGQGDAINKGFRLATGQIMNWLCSDDLLGDDALWEIAAAFLSESPDIIVGGCKVINSDDEILSVHHCALPVAEVSDLSFGDMISFQGSWQKGLYFYQPELFFTRDLWERSGGGIRESLFYAMDYDMFLRFALAGAKVYHSSAYLGASRQHEEQKTRHSLPSYLPTVGRILRDFQLDLGKITNSLSTK